MKRTLRLKNEAFAFHPTGSLLKRLFFISKMKPLLFEFYLFKRLPLVGNQPLLVLSFPSLKKKLEKLRIFLKPGFNALH